MITLECILLCDQANLLSPIRRCLHHDSPVKISPCGLFRRSRDISLRKGMWAGNAGPVPHRRLRTARLIRPRVSGPPIWHFYSSTLASALRFEITETLPRAGSHQDSTPLFSTIWRPICCYPCRFIVILKQVS